MKQKIAKYLNEIKHYLAVLTHLTLSSHRFNNNAMQN